MKSIFQKENTKGGVLVNTFAQISKKKSHLVIRPLTEKEIEKMNQIKFCDQKGKF